MNQTLKDKMAKAIHRTIANEVGRGRPIDPIDLSERLLDSVELIYDMVHEESGIASIPLDLRADTAAWDIQQNKPAPDPDDDRPHFLAPPPTRQSVTPLKVPDPKAKGLLVMPGDPEFDKTKPADVGARPGVIKASLRKVARPGSNSPAKQYWDEAGLIEAVDKATPAEIPFDIQRVDGSAFRIVAKKNIQNRQGLGGIVLTYRDPRVGEGGEVSLTAQHPFSLYDETIDIDSGLKNIVDQLMGLYRDRSGGMADPVAVGAEPDMNMIRARISAGAADGGKIDPRLGVGEAARIDLQPGYRATGQTHVPFEERNRDEILQRALQSARQSNQSLVPPESRLK